MIIFKNPDDQKDFRYLDSRLMYIVDYASRLAWAMEKEPLTITSIVRNDRSTHNQSRPYRFIDWGVFEHIDNEWFRDYLNKRFPYGSGRKQTVPPLDHGTAPHFHCQVRPLRGSSRREA